MTAYHTYSYGLFVYSFYFFKLSFSLRLHSAKWFLITREEHNSVWRWRTRSPDLGLDDNILNQ